MEKILVALPGRVVQVEGERVEVLAYPRSDCQGCSACKSLIAQEDRQERKIWVSKGSWSLNPGDGVTLDLAPGEGSIAAVLLFLLPLVGFFLGLWLGPLLIAPFLALPEERLSFLCGLVGLIGAFGILGMADRKGLFSRFSLKIVALRKDGMPDEEKPGEEKKMN